MVLDYQTLYKESIESPETFWAKAADAIVWDKPWDKVLDDSNAPFYRWFSGGKLNTCYNAVDYHCEHGRADQAAIIYDSPVTNTCKTYTYRELQSAVSRLAGAMIRQGIKKGDRVIIYMPMVPEALFGMLACARIGAVHSVVFGGFAADELASRIDDATPKLILSASCGIEPTRTVAYKPLLDKAREIATHKPDLAVVLQREQHPADLDIDKDIDWQAFIANAPETHCVPMDATDLLYILYTSGTTGKPKGIVRDHGGHAVALKWSMEHIYNVQPGEVYFAASDIGWVVGHSYICYGPLLHGCTTVLFEGKPVGTPDASAFWRVIDQHKVTTLFTAPTAFRAIRKEDPQGKLIQQANLSSLRALFLAGERCDINTLEWAQNQLQIPVIDHWWQTETGWAIAANCLGIETMPVKPGSPCRAVPGYQVEVLNEEGTTASADEIGAIAIKLPLPPGSLPTLWQANERYYENYLSRYEGYYLTGDAGMIDQDDYLWVMSRIDDVINVAGHRLSTGTMEDVLSSHPAVAECAVFGVQDALKGELPLGLVVLKAGATIDEQALRTELIQKVRDQIGPVAVFKLVTVVTRLPKTRSGKILRGTMKKIADDTPWKMPATIDSPDILDEIGEALKDLGYPKAS